MDAKDTALKGGAISMLEKRAENGSEVVINIASEESSAANMDVKNSEGSFSEATTEADTAGFKAKSSVQMSFPSPDIPRFCPSADKPPKIPTTNDTTLTRKMSRTRSVFSKPKSRFGEQSYIDANVLEENDELSLREQLAVNSNSRNSLSRAISQDNKSFSSIRTDSSNNPKMSTMESDDEEDICKKVELHKEKHNRVKKIVLIQWVAFVFILGCLVASLTWEKFENSSIWELEIWKFCVLVLMIISGMLVTNWIMHVIVFLIEMNFLLRKKVLYFVHGLKKSVQVFIWLQLVLITWLLLFDRGVKRSETARKFLHFITWTLVSLIIGAFLWLSKTLLLKILASRFHVNRFFDRIQESIFHQYVLRTLSGPPFIEEAEKVRRSPSFSQLSISRKKKGKECKETKILDIGKVHQLKQEKVSSWTMKVLVDAIVNSGMSTISNTLDESVHGGESKEIHNDMEAIAAAYCIFRNVAPPRSKYIEEEDLLRFMIKEEVDLVFPLIDRSETGRIDKKALIVWVVRVYKDRRALAHALSDTKTAIKQLNNLVTGILIIATFIIWLLFMEIATKNLLLFLSSQVMAAGFMFKDTCKTIFEAIIFVFIMHPFDVGDRCVVDDVPLLVEEMNLLTTVFLKLDNEKVYYPNSVLSTKRISNYNRSPDMGDVVEFSIDFMTPVEKIGMLKEKIKSYLENNPQHWHPNHNVVVKEIENVNKMKMALYCNHTMNYQEFGEKNKRRTELAIEMKKMFEELNIKYNLLPQQVHLAHIGTESTNVTGK